MAPLEAWILEQNAKNELKFSSIQKLRGFYNILITKK